MTRKPLPIDERFWRHVDRSAGPDDCTGSRSQDGYGLFAIGKTTHHASRVASILVDGPIASPAIMVMHSCDNPPCCNPAHLSRGDVRENSRQMVERGRAASHVHPERLHRGSQASWSKLTEADIVVIRREFALGANQRALARRYGVNRQTLIAAVKGRTWRHVPLDGQAGEPRATRPGAEPRRPGVAA